MDASASNTRQRKVVSRRRSAAASARVRRHESNSTAVPAAAQVSVALSIPQHVREKLSREWIVRVSTTALLFHTLYSRGVCPAPPTETLRVHNEHHHDEGRKRRLTATERKFEKFGRSLHRLVEQWTLLCSYVPNMERVLITYGPSWSRQREHYILDFSALRHHPQGTTSGEEPGPGQEHALSRRLIRAILDGISNDNSTTSDFKKEEHSLARPSPTASSYLVHISVWITHSVVEVLFEKTMDSDTDDATSCQLLQSLILRPGYSSTRTTRSRINGTSSKQTMQLPHVVTAHISSSLDMNACKNCSCDDWVEDNGIWLSLPTHLKGFRL